MTEQKVRSKDPTRYNTSYDVAQAGVNRQIKAEWLDVEKHVAWHGGYILDQISVRRNEDGWQLILKVYRNGRPYVSYVQTDTLPEAFDFGGELASKGLLTWQSDEWPSKWLKKLLGLQ